MRKSTSTWSIHYDTIYISFVNHKILNLCRYRDFKICIGITTNWGLITSEKGEKKTWEDLVNSEISLLNLMLIYKTNHKKEKKIRQNYDFSCEFIDVWLFFSVFLYA